MHSTFLEQPSSLHFPTLFLDLSAFGIAILCVNNCCWVFFSGLTDEVLWSILRRGCQNLTSLDLSLSPHFLTEFAVLCIGKFCTGLSVRF